MIEPMKFVSISGPRDDLDRMVNQVLCRYEIHLENALTELKSVSKLIPCPGTNPYREPYEAAEKLTALCSEGTKAVCTPSPASMTAEEAIAFVQETKKAMEAADAEKEALKQKLKDTHALYEQVNLYRELDFSIPELLKFRHIKYRFGRVLKELYPQLEAFAESSEDTILYKCHETDHYVTLIYFVPGPVSERIDAAFSSLQFERIILPDQYTGTPTEEIRRLEKELEDIKSQITQLDAREKTYLEDQKPALLQAVEVLGSYNVRRCAAVTDKKEHPFYILCGWTTETDARALQKELEEDASTFFVIEDSREHVTSTPPTRLKNPALLRPFEMFVKMYGLPAYNEFDPTLLIAVTYSLFFGFMFGDVGQGLLLLGGHHFLLWILLHHLRLPLWKRLRLRRRDPSPLAASGGGHDRSPLCGTVKHRICHRHCPGHGYDPPYDDREHGRKLQMPGYGKNLVRHQRPGGLRLLPEPGCRHHPLYDRKAASSHCRSGGHVRGPAPSDLFKGAPGRPGGKAGPGAFRRSHVFCGGLFRAV